MLQRGESEKRLAFQTEAVTAAFCSEDELIQQLSFGETPREIRNHCPSQKSSWAQRKNSLLLIY